jgi:hypothetical protein
MGNDRSVFDTPQVELDDLKYRTSVEQAQNFRQDEACGDGSDERRSHSFAREHGDAAPVKITIFQHLLVGWTASNIFGIVTHFPDGRCRTGSGQSMKPHCSEVTITTAEAGFHNQVKTDLIERPSRKRVVDATERHRRFAVSPSKGCVK